MATQKQQKLINLIVANLGNVKETKTMKELMLEAGYSKSQSTNPYQILESETIQEGIQPFVDKLLRERERIMDELAQRDISDERYKDMVDSMDKFTKNAQLLSGGHTENVKHDLSDYTDAELAKLADESTGS